MRAAAVFLFLAAGGCGLFGGREDAVAGGGLCGDPGLVGEVIGDIPGPGSCGVEDAVRVTGVSGLSLSQSPTINCQTARALRAWVDEGVKPAVGRQGGGAVSLRVAAHYVCRTRNHRAGARLSEHSFGNAIDISAIELADGTALTVRDDWRGGGRETMRAMHRAACGPFGTVLGPDSDRFHQSHFHFDTADYRSGPFCR